MNVDEETINLPSEVYSLIGAKLYLKSKNADVYFLFENNGDIERVPAHKILLAGASAGVIFHFLAIMLNSFSL